MNGTRRSNGAIFILEKQENEYWVTVKELSGCYASGRTIEEAIANVKDAVTEHISALKEYGDSVPEVFLNETYNYQIKYDLQTLFKKFNVINKTVLAEKAGINSSLLRQYSIGLAFASDKQKLKIENAIHEIGSSLLEVCL